MLKVFKTYRKPSPNQVGSRILGARFSRGTLLAMAITNGVLSTTALGKINDGHALSAREASTNAEDAPNDIKIYTAEELKPAPIVPVEDLSDRVSDQVVSILKGVGSSSESQTKIQQHKTNDPHADYFLMHSVLLEPSGSSSDPNAIRAQVQKEAQSVATKRVLDESPFIQKLKSGFNFDLDFGSIFGKGKSRATAETSPARTVRYGLVLKSVNAKKNLTKAQAAVNSSLAEDMSYLNEADVQWTIGPITENTSRKAFNANVDADSEDQAAPPAIYQEPLVERVDKSNTDENFWANGAPSPVFKTNIKPSSDKSLQGALSSQKKLGLNIVLAQEQGLYELDILTPETAGAKRTMEQQFKLPIVGTFSIGRRYGDKMQVISTSANNVLVKKELPKLSFHYFEQTKQYVSDGIIGDTTDPVQVTFKVHTKAQVAGKLQEKHENQKGAEVGFAKTF